MAKRMQNPEIGIVARSSAAVIAVVIALCVVLALATREDRRVTLQCRTSAATAAFGCPDVEK